MTNEERIAMIEANMEASRRTLRPPYITNDDADWLLQQVKLQATEPLFEPSSE